MLTKSLYSTANILLSLMLALLLSMCRSAQHKNETYPIIAEQELETGLNSHQIDNIYYLIPSPAEMLHMLQGKEMVFNQSLLNPHTNYDYYANNNRVQAMNLGIYLADLAYASMFNRHEVAIDYLEIIQKLVDGLEIHGTIHESMIIHEDNLNHVDSLLEISNEAFVSMVRVCEESGQTNILVLIISGVLVESLYLASSYVEDQEDAEGLFQDLADQKYSMDNLLSLAKSLSEDPYVARAVTDLKPLEELYGKLEKSSGSTTVKKEGDGKLIIGGNQPILSSEEFEELKKIVTDIRNDIVSRNI